MRADLPTGTVTFLFTDVEGSTKLLHSLGAEAYADALAQHRKVIRDACALEGGVEVDTQGDAFFFAFPSAPRAVSAASAMTEALVSGVIQVRVGLHTGSPLLAEEGYVGDDVHFAARVAASGHGGQVILSRTTAELVGVTLTDLGEHRLKDIEQAVSIFQLGAAIFPPLKTISNTNLPRPASSFVGRERELRDVLGVIESGVRLLTLTGPGGSGKTRLALEAAATLVPSYKAGTFWVGLASLRDTSLVTVTISQTIGSTNGLAEHIGEREMLLLLDNLEQVVEVAPEISALLPTCPNLTLLVTSRELLRVQGEVAYEVPPLTSAEAISLFCARSRLEPSEEIAALCARLDSLPLAVELAAARTKALSPDQILERLSQRLDLLKGGRDADPRQQTLRATIEWSYELLTPDEQQLFARLSVFAGGCILENAEEVCAADIDTLQSLVEKSLLSFSNERYWMLETIRELALERLDESREREPIQKRHADWVLRLAHGAEEGLRSRDAPYWRNKLDPEQANLRACLAWLKVSALVEPQLEIVSGVGWYWQFRGQHREGLAWAQSALAQSEGIRTQSRARVLAFASYFASLTGEPELGRTLAAESIELSREVHDARGLALGLLAGGVSAGVDGQIVEADRLLSLASDEARRVGEVYTLLRCTVNLAAVSLELGNYARGAALAEEVLVTARELGLEDLVGFAILNRTSALAQAGRVDDALASAREGLSTGRRIGDVRTVLWSLLMLACLTTRETRIEPCARLMGAVEARRRETGLVLVGLEASLWEDAVEELRDTLGAATYEAAFAEGQSMSLDDAVDLGLELAADSGVL